MMDMDGREGGEIERGESCELGSGRGGDEMEGERDV